MGDVSLECITGTPNCYNNINISALRCNKSIPGAMWNLSRYCYYATNLDSTECFPKNYYTNDTQDYNIELFTSLWIIFVGFVGVVGNMLTIIAIPYNMIMKRNNLHKTSSPLMIMIVFLAVCELFGCANNLGNYFMKHGGAAFRFKIVFHPVLCTFHWYLTFFGIYCGWITLAVISLIRCLAVVSKASQKIFAKKKIFFIIIPTIIFFGFLTAVPFLLDPGADLGFQCSVGHCHFVDTGIPYVAKAYRKKSLHVVYGFSSSIVLICYSVMYYRVRVEGKKIKQTSKLEAVKEQIDERDMEMTWSVLIIFFCSFVCQTVFIFCGATTSAKGGIGLRNSPSRTICRCVNWTQYAVDPFIYAIRNKEFRQAYKDAFYPVTTFYGKMRTLSISKMKHTTQTSVTSTK